MSARLIWERVEQEYGPYCAIMEVMGHRPPALESNFGLLLQCAQDRVISQRYPR